MRKFVLVVAVLFMTVPAMAVAPDVNITCSADYNEVTVSYAITNNPSGHLVRAFGLTIDVVGANITKVLPVNVNYRIYPGEIVITGGNVTDYNTPYAPGDIGDANVIVEMGSLYTEDPCYSYERTHDANLGHGMKPLTTGTLLKFWVDGDCTYTITENAVRGGVVMENPAEARNVHLQLCSGSAEVACIVPDVVGEANAVAQGHITDAGLLVGNITTECNGTIAAGYVLRTNPVGGTEVDCGSAVDMVVSIGPCCIVPDVVGMTQNDANAAIIAAGFTVGTKTISATCGAIAELRIISSTPGAGAQPGCGTAVATLRCECYAGQGDYAQWEKVGKPKCWCYPRQCKGDADGAPYGKKNYWVDVPDLTILKSAWQIANGPVSAPGACADFDRLPYGKKNYRVDVPDLTIMKTNWQIANGPSTGCQPGNRAP